MVFDAAGHQLCGDAHAQGFSQTQLEARIKAAPIARGDVSLGVWARVQAHLSGNDSVNLAPFAPPFRPADREAAMQRAYRAFAKRASITEGVSDTPIVERSPLVEVI